MNLGVCDDDAGARGILDCELGLAFFAANAPDASAQMVSLQRLHILDFKRLQVQVIETQNRDCILQVEAQHEALEEVRALLNRAHIHSRFRRLSDKQLQMSAELEQDTY